MIHLFLMMIVSCLAFANSFDWQGHRGARGLYPENTIGAMEEALKYPITTLEMDVVISKDNKVVVSHEPWMGEEFCRDLKGNRVIGRNHNLYKMDYEEIRKYDCGSLPHPRFPDQKKIVVGKPLLETLLAVTEDTLKRLNRTDVKYNIEIKSTVEDERDGYQPDYKTFTDLVVKTITKKLSKDRFSLQSFDWRVLRHLHEKYPDIQTVALIEGPFNSKEILKTLGFRPTVFSPDYAHLRLEDVTYFHSQKVKVIPWTVNEVKDMEALKLMNVDGIITDYPNRLSGAAFQKCGPKENLFEGKCVQIPKHALPSNSIPGWECKRGFVQKRWNCIEIKIPPHALLSEDGKNWECKKGFERYRGTCKKLK